MSLDPEELEALESITQEWRGAVLRGETLRGCAEWRAARAEPAADARRQSHEWWSQTQGAFVKEVVRQHDAGLINAYGVLNQRYRHNENEHSARDFMFEAAAEDWNACRSGRGALQEVFDAAPSGRFGRRMAPDY